MRKFNLEQIDSLMELRDHSGFYILRKEIEELVVDQEELALKVPTDKGEAGELLYKKAMADGARKLAREINLVFDTLNIRLKRE